MFDKVKVLVNYQGLSEKSIQCIRDVSERVEVEKAPNEKGVPNAARDAEVIFGTLSKELILTAERLRWVQISSAGVDNYLYPEILNSDIILTSSSGMHRISMSELALTMILMLAKRMHKFVRLQSERKWQRINLEEIAGKTIGILGLGNIGMETAMKAKCFSTRVLALDERSVRRPTYVDELVGPEDLDYILQESDYLVITVPLTSKTHHLVSERELKLMKPTAYLINIARGAVVDNEVLLKALKEGWIAGAGLDVFEQEPLLEDSEFWRLENVVLTPHIGGSSPYYEERAVEMFCGNLQRYLEGRPLINIVDKKAGY